MQIHMNININPDELTITGLYWNEDHWDWQHIEYNGIELEPHQYDDEALQDWLDEIHQPFSKAA